MAHYGDRRYRLNGPEVGPVGELVKERILGLMEDREDLKLAEILFRLLYRFDTYQEGRPNYPEPVTRQVIESWIRENGPLTSDPVEALEP